MSDIAYFEYALVLPEERYLIEVQVRKSDSGELRGQEEVESIAKECLAIAIGEGREGEVKGFRLTNHMVGGVAGGLGLMVAISGRTTPLALVR
jgi:hypothetical protein